jgi:protein-S-isoprenylcysteine O-methyltransferase Ste14
LSLVRSSAPQAANVPWQRFGDAVLCMLYLLIALGPFVQMMHAVAAGTLLVALHMALIGVTSTIMAALVLSRRKALLNTTRWFEQVAAIVGSFIILPLSWISLRWESDVLLELLSVGFILSYIWIVWALLTLRNSFSVFPEARQLISAGPYRYVRHPLYFAYFFTYTLILIPRFGVLALALMLIGVATEVYRSRCEERVLRQAFPEYDTYARRVRAFLPINRTVP